MKSIKLITNLIRAKRAIKQLDMFDAGTPEQQLLSQISGAVQFGKPLPKNHRRGAQNVRLYFKVNEDCELEVVSTVGADVYLSEQIRQRALSAHCYVPNSLAGRILCCSINI